MDILSESISRFLHKRDKNAYYRVRWRIYHGWYAGKTKTKERREIEAVVNRFTSRTIGKVVVGNDFRFGDELLCATSRNPLYATVRNDIETGRVKVQKMVDTALVCDLLHAVRFGEADVNIVIGDDDDLLPGVFTAEAWRGTVAMLHRREATNRFLKTDGVLHYMELS